MYLVCEYFAISLLGFVVTNLQLCTYSLRKIVIFHVFNDISNVRHMEKVEIVVSVTQVYKILKLTRWLSLKQYSQVDSTMSTYLLFLK
jgi:hypothetical protein